MPWPAVKVLWGRRVCPAASALRFQAAFRHGKSSVDFGPARVSTTGGDSACHPTCAHELSVALRPLLAELHLRPSTVTLCRRGHSGPWPVAVLVPPRHDDFVSFCVAWPSAGGAVPGCS